MPEEFFVMKWCMEHNWKPWEYYGGDPDTHWNAYVFRRWQEMMREEAHWMRHLEQTEQQRAERRAK